LSENLLPELPPPADPVWARITAAWSRDETEADDLLAQATLPPAERSLVLARAADLVARVRAQASEQTAVESFMRQYDLSSEEGVLLMCVAEALLRIPDKTTADKLIRDKLGEADWKSTSAAAIRCSSTPRPGASCSPAASSILPKTRAATSPARSSASSAAPASR
jgi:RHH-type proline utilization regulon transcriptional repressor/proline dehydrogenase/delta 1-pyrroline-5-carboxylate dehydrogenase